MANPAIAMKQVVFYLNTAGTIAIGCLLTTCLAQAQIIPDNTLPENSRVAPSCTVCTIEGGTVRGANLFHSFQEFSVPTGGAARFNNSLQIQNILTRVTGTSRSNIDGLIQANGTANLFLLNPNGIIFGRNARLDVGGSFLASTARSIHFADGTQFSATVPQTTPLLTVSTPIGLQFGSNPAGIRVQGNGQGLRRNNSPIIDTQNALRVGPDRTLALIGGEIVLDGGTLKTSGGRIELGSVAAPSFVSLTPASKGFALGYESVSSFGTIRLSGASSADASGVGGGDIQIQGRQVLVRDGSQVETSTLQTAPGGSLTVVASELVEVSGSTADNPGDNRLFPSSLSSDNREAGQIPATLTIHTQRLVIRSGARISASNTADGQGGTIAINASDSVELIGTGISQGGLRSSGISVQNRGSGQSGNLTIQTEQLIIRDGAEVSASAFGEGDGGTVTVNASRSLELSGTSANGQLRSRLVAGVGNPSDVLAPGIEASEALATGKGGNLIINTRQLTVQNGAAIAVSSRSTANQAQGAGTLTVDAETIRLDNQGAIAAETFSGQGGNIILQVKDLLLLRHNSQISTTAGTANARGDGGNLTITAPFIIGVLSENSDITANAFTGRGGNITITTNAIYGLRFQPQLTPFSDITASSQFGISGTVILNTPDLDPSRGLVALPINLTDPAQQISQDCTPGSKASASSFVATGRGGIPLSLDEPLENRAVVMEWVPLPEEGRGRWGDGAMGSGEDEGKIQSTLREGQSPTKFKIQNSSLTPRASHLAPPHQSKIQNPKSKIPPPIIEAQGWIVGADGVVELVADVPTVNSARFWTAPVSCRAFQGN